MKHFVAIFLIIGFVVGCSKHNKVPLIAKVENFNVSECQNNCGIDSIGVRKNEIISGNLNLKLGYIVNCAWKEAFIKSIELKNDTLLVELDRPADIDTIQVDSETLIEHTYPIYDCECFFFFEFAVKDMSVLPNVVRLGGHNKYWDELPQDYLEVEDGF